MKKWRQGVVTLSLCSGIASWVCAIALILPGTPALGDDWPTWRYDANRSAASAEELSDQLALAWTRDYPALEMAWEEPVNQDKMAFDRIYEPVVAGTTMFIGSNRNDTLTALNTRSGEEKWRFYADGPVRFAPVAHAGKVYFTSDDGYLYCLDAETGRLVWKHRGGPSDRKILGNGRMISTWPARGGPVLADGTVYYAASIWPFMGIFLHAVDAQTGTTVWTNDAVGSTFVDQPHGGAVSFGGVAPQGALAAVADKLLVPNGRSVPACFDRLTGRLDYYHLSGSSFHKLGGSINRRREGGSHVSAIGKYFLNHRGINTALYDLASGEMIAMWETTTYPVLTEEVLYLSGNPLVALDLANLRPQEYEVTEKDRKTGQSKTTTKRRWQLDELWRYELDATRALIKAGDRLYAGGDNLVTALDVSQHALNENGSPKTVWRADIEGTAARIIAADDRLFVVTLEGRIHAFAPAQSHQVKPRTYLTGADKPSISDQADKLSRKMLQATTVEKGYCLVYGLESGDLVEALATRGEFRIVALDPDPKKVDQLRRRFDAAGLYGTRVTVHVGNASTFDAPPYVAALTTSENLRRAGLGIGGETIFQKIFSSMRPYGGVAYLPLENQSHRIALGRWVQKLELAGARLSLSGDHLVLSRAGRLPGAADWTHQAGDVANTSKSDDKRVKLPLGLLWFGGNTHEDILPRHSHGPPEQVVGGRLFIEGIDCLSARDVYTGIVLWKRTFDDLGTFGVYYDESYARAPLGLDYNQGHIAGANARGTNYVATADKLYLVIGPHCQVLDPATGETIATFTLPAEPGSDARPQWGYIGVYQDLLIAGAGAVRFSELYGTPARGSASVDNTSSRKLVVMDRHSGKVLWTKEARFAFRHNAVAAGGGKLFLIDRLPDPVVDVIKRRGETLPGKPTLWSLDPRTGQPVWSTSENVFGTWLAYSKEHDLLLQSGRASRDMLRDEPSEQMIVYRAGDGSLLWDKPLTHSGPCMLHGDTIYLNASSTRGSAVNLLTGEPLMRLHPLTHQEVPWQYQRRYGCNSVVASEYLLTFRSGAAGYYDLTTNSGTGNLGGFKSGCTSNLIAADGLLNAPDYTRTCNCNYQNQTSLALVHMPEAETWTFDEIDAPSGNVARQLGVNFGAPGDRRATTGTLWLDYPSVGGPSPDVPIEVDGSPVYFRHHSSRFSGAGAAWIAASGVEGARSITIRLNPETADAPRLAVPVAHVDDDAEEDETGDVSLSSSDLELTLDSSRQTVGIRFHPVPIPPGSRIDRAYVQFEVDETSSEPTRLEVRAQATADAARFSDREHDLSSRKKTTAVVRWQPAPWKRQGLAGPDQRTPDLAAVLQEVVDRADWKAGGAVAVLIGGTGKRVAKAFGRDPSEAARLCIDFHDPSNPIPPEQSKQTAAGRYTVRLHFSEPLDTVQPGDRLFDVALNGVTVLKRFDVLTQAGGPRRSIVKEFRGIEVEEELTVKLTPITDRPAVLSGIEAVAETK